MSDKMNNAASIIDRIMETARASIPDTLAQDVKDKLSVAIQGVISDLDVVTREELDVQKEVLSKTRAKVDKMEQIISDLEKQLDIK